MDTKKYIKTNRVFPKVSSLALGLTIYKTISYSSIKMHSPLLPDPSKLEISRYDQCFDLTHQIFSLMSINDKNNGDAAAYQINQKFLLPHRRILAFTHIETANNKSKNTFLSGNYFAIILNNIRSYMSKIWNRMGKIFTPFSKINRSKVVFVLACLFFIFVSPLFAETISYESALVWRADASGDYSLPDIAANSTHVIDPGITTKGVIKFITATWQSEGEAQLFVSADDGLHFTPVVNGVPLISGFTEGTSLKWKAMLGPDSKLLEVKVVYRDSSVVIGSFGEPQLSGFKYKKSVTLLGSSAGTLFNYQVKIKVGESASSQDADVTCEGHLATDNFSDVRFTLSDGETLLPYYLDTITGTKPGRVAEFFVKVPQIPKEGIVLYIYYGNAGGVSSLSDPTKTFDFYEDFSNALSEDKWGAHSSPGGSLALSSEGLKVDASSLISKAFEFKNGIIEFSSTAKTGFETRFIIRDENPDSESDVNEVAYSSAYGGAQHCLAVGNIVKANDDKPIEADKRYDYRIIASGANITFDRFSEGFAEKQASVSYEDATGPKKGFIGIKVSGAGNGESLTIFHWVRARKHAEPEPRMSASLVGKEEVATLPIFDHIGIAANGDLILEDGFVLGSYTPLAITAKYPVRIIVPSWKGSGVSLDVSADGGQTYKKDCVSETYYYASKKDFKPGERVESRVRLKKTGTTSASLSSLELMTIQYASGSIVVLAPNGAEELAGGSKQEIKWTAWDYEKSYPMKLEYSLDAGKTFKLITDKAENSGSYIWTVANVSGIEPDTALIRVSDSFDNVIADTSDATFTIVASPSVEGEEKNEAAIVSEVKPVATVAASAQEAETAETKKAEKKPEQVSVLKEYELLVKLGDNYSSNPNEDAKASFKEGDIIVVKPAGYEWSQNERDSFLIVKVTMTEQEAAELTQPKTAAIGKLDKDGKPVEEIVRMRKNKVDLKKLGTSVTKRLRKGATSANRVLDDKILTTAVISEK